MSYRTPSYRTQGRGWAAAVTGLALTVSLLSAAPGASAAVVRTATLAGSLQSELGCPEDWSPSCPDTVLADVEGTSTYAAEFTLPAGSYEYKIAIDGSWDENYGNGGVLNGPNLALTVAGDARVRVVYDDVTHLLSVTPLDLAGDEVLDADRELAQPALRPPPTTENFYFVMADRFRNGDPGNDLGGIAGDRLAHGFDHTDKGFYHGGDLAGVIQELDYIEGLGTTAIWLTPSFKNRPVQGLGENVSAAYHGYWTIDYTQIDPHLGTNEEMRELIDAAHERGMKVFFDIVTNHTADVINYAEGQYGYVSKADRPYTDAAGTVFDPADYAGTDTFPALDPATSFPYTPVVNSPEDASVKVPAWLNDPTLYHNRGDSTFAGESSEYGDFIGLDDLMTEHPAVVEGMKDIFETWVEFGVDGFRIDTMKHVNIEFWQEFAPHLRAVAEGVGNDDFFAFGEVYDADPAYLSRFSTAADVQATIDFAFQQKAVAYARGEEAGNLAELFDGDDWYTDADSNAYSSPTFLGNHDMGRVGNFLTGASADADQLLTRDQLAHAIMYLTRGQPVVYYGDEQGFVGDGGDKDARQDMFASQVASYNDDDLIGTDATTATDNFDTGHPMYRWISDLAALREAHPALADGAQVTRYAAGDAGLFVASRVDDDTDREYLVAFNNSSEPRTVEVDTYSRRSRFVPVWAGVEAARSGVDNRVTVTVPPLSAAAWRSTRRMHSPQAATGVVLTTPVEGAAVAPGTGSRAGRAEISAGLADDTFAEVTFAARAVGSSDWTTLGTDDGAPYRVYADVTGYPVGTLMEYRAVALDAEGRVTVDGSWGVISGPATAGGGGGGVGAVEQPGAVAVAGDHNSEMGCPGDWQPDCDAAQLTLDPADDIWQGTFDLPAGNYAYKAAINRSWDENYGDGGVTGGANIGYAAPGGPVTFYYDHRTKHVSSTAQGPIVTAAGSFQSELGCPGDWSPDCLRSWVQDPDHDGSYTLSTTQIPAGSYEVKAAHGLTWDENYGAGGAAGGANIGFTVPADGITTTFSYVLATHVLTVTTSVGGVAPDLAAAKAHWISDDYLAWPTDGLPSDPRTLRWVLHDAPEGGLAVDGTAVVGPAGSGTTELVYDPAGLPAQLQQAYPHLAGHVALRIPDRARRDIDDLLTGQLAVGLYDAGRLIDASGVQIPGVLDDRYAWSAADRDLGVTWSRWHGHHGHHGRAARSAQFALWAPTAKDVDLLLWPASGAGEPTVVGMDRHRDGTWHASRRIRTGQQYLYRVTVYAPSTGRVEVNEVTDPYSVALTVDSTRSVAVDLDDPALAPRQWRRAEAPVIAQPEDQSIYELHVRDFSVDDPDVPAAHRGRYLAFADEGQGRQRLRDLADAGLTTVHLLPTFDIATIPEQPADQASPACDLASFPPDSPAQQECIDAVRADDAFNWGYDPFHWLAPEGSYAVEPTGPSRTVEFRTMVGALHADGLNVVLDVVFNHTAASGQAATSVLDRIVPGYYHRLNPATGAVETSTCCQNIATEHAMSEKIMVDAVVLWAEQYKVDGFRFDLMGHHSVANMQAVREALDQLSVPRNGVDGSRVSLYGEGWNFGEVADDARFVQASQGALGGTEIATFSDRLRDGVRGGGPFDEDPRIQGLGSGLYTDPNDSPANGTVDEQLARLLRSHDQVKLGLAGNLAGYTFIGAAGTTVSGAEVDYNGSPAGYAQDPAEIISYVDAHDNETLFDALTYKLPPVTTMSDRVRMNTVALSFPTLSQTASLWHAGADLLRSKSLDRNSYDSGDWFNHIGWDGTDNGFGRGLPPAADNESKWPYAAPLLADPALQPSAADVATAAQGAEDLLRLRYASPLFRLGDAKEIGERVRFPIGGTDQLPGVVVMYVDDTTGTDLDPASEGVLVVFNASPDVATQQVPGLAGADLALHPIQADGTDPVVQETGWDADTGTVSVPARTVAVLTRS